MAKLDSLIKHILPKRRAKAGGVAQTETFEQSGVVTLPTYRQYLTNISDFRLQSDSKDLLQWLLKYDPDASAALHAFLTISNTDWTAFAKTPDGQISPEGQAMLQAMLHRLARRWDYSQGFELKRTIGDMRDDLKYSIMKAGAAFNELVLDKTFTPVEIRTVDAWTIRWNEDKPGNYKPYQESDTGEDVDLNIPTFFAKLYRRDPSGIYTESMFVSCITTIVARIRLMNDLYSIMQVTGYPRIGLKVLQQVAIDNAPANIKSDPTQLRLWLSNLLSREANKFAAINPQQVYAYPDSIQPHIINEKNAAATLDISELVDTLNSQNQAALKVVATVIGRGESGVNTASVEARIFSLAADSLNKAVDEQLSEILTLAMRMQGFDGYVDFWSTPVELRPELELEPQKVMRQSRLLEELSLGLISDEEYHLKMHRRLPALTAKKLSGTNFLSQKMDTSSVSPNSDPLGRSLSPEGSESARSNGVDKS